MASKSFSTTNLKNGEFLSQKVEHTPIIIEDEDEDFTLPSIAEEFKHDIPFLESSLNKNVLPFLETSLNVNEPISNSERYQRENRVQSPLMSEADTVLSMNQAHIELLEQDSEDFKKKLLHAESMYLRKERFLAFKIRIKKVSSIICAW